MVDSKDIVIVVCTPRSGSSWLSRLLRAHAQLQVYTHNTQDNHLLYLLRPLKSLNPLGNDYSRPGSLAERLFGRLKLRVLRSVFRPSSVGRKLLIATPTTAAFLPLIVKGFPDAKFVHLQRNTLDRLASFRKFIHNTAERTFVRRYTSGLHRGWPFALRQALAHWFHRLRWLRFGHSGYLGTRPDGFQKAAKLPFLQFLCWYFLQYEKEIRDALAEVPEERKCVCTYEGLVKNYKHEVTRLMDFIGVETPDDFLERTAGTIRDTAVGSHKTQFSAEELAEIQRSLHVHGQTEFTPLEVQMLIRA